MSWNLVHNIRITCYDWDRQAMNMTDERKERWPLLMTDLSNNTCRNFIWRSLGLYNNDYWPDNLSYLQATVTLTVIIENNITSRGFLSKLLNVWTLSTVPYSKVKRTQLFGNWISSAIEVNSFLRTQQSRRLPPPHLRMETGPVS
jgi:hypothetical protein